MSLNLEHATTQRLNHDLAAAALKLPKAVTAAQAALAAVEALKPPGESGTVADAYLAGDPELAHARAVARSVSRAVHEGWAEAIRRASVDVTRACSADSADLLAQLAAKAAPLIADLTRAADLNIELQALVRTGRTEDARILADIDLTAAHLGDLFGLRHRIVGRHPWGPCDTWRNPEKLPRVSPAQSQSQQLRGGIRAGAGLWFPTPGEATSRAAELKAKADKAKATDSQGTRRKVAILL